MKFFGYILLFLSSHLGLFAQAFLPAAPSGQVIHHRHYSLCYAEDHEQASWVYYELTAYEASSGRYERTDNFRENPKVTTGSASLSDYRASGYDRGHLAPAGDMAFSMTAMSESFYLSNMSPQHPSFNRGVWKQLEGLVRSWAVGQSVLYVATGPVLEPGLRRIGPNQVSIPNRFYKVLLDYDEENGSYSAIGFILPNRKGQGPLAAYAVSVDEVERLTGIDFYSQLPDSIETIVEKKIDPGYWDWQAAPVTRTGKSTAIPARQCAGITQKGLRCRNRTKSETGYCHLHEGSSVGKQKPATAPKKRTTSVRCIGTTKSGARCKRNTLSRNQKCWQHGGN